MQVVHSSRVNVEITPSDGEVIIATAIDSNVTCEVCLKMLEAERVRDIGPASTRRPK